MASVARFLPLSEYKKHLPKVTVIQFNNRFIIKLKTKQTYMLEAGWSEVGCPGTEGRGLQCGPGWQLVLLWNFIFTFEL